MGEHNKYDIHDRKHGKWVIKYQDGSVYSDGEYFKGEPHGLWTYFTDTGKVISRLRFNNGVLVERLDDDIRLNKLDKIIRKLKKMKLTNDEIYHLKESLDIWN